MYAFFLDIDGTLFDGERVSDEVISSIANARNNGHMVFINTARAFIAMPEQIYDLPVNGFINSFGLEIFADGGFIHRSFMSKRKILRSARYAFKNNVSIYYEGQSSAGINRSREGSIDLKNMRDVRDALSKSKFCKISLHPKTAEEHKMRLSRGYSLLSGDIVRKGYCKSRGIQIVEKYYNIPHENTVAIGDTDPDIEMLGYAGIGVCMGNGTQNLKDSVKYITLSISEDGVAHAINRIIAGDLEQLKK